MACMHANSFYTLQICLRGRVSAKRSKASGSVYPMRVTHDQPSQSLNGFQNAQLVGIYESLKGKWICNVVSKVETIDERVCNS